MIPMNRGAWRNAYKYHTFEFNQGYTLVLDAEQAKTAIPRILQNYRVPAAHSADL